MKKTSRPRNINISVVFFFTFMPYQGIIKKEDVAPELLYNDSILKEMKKN